jgi:hypothetical protein
MADAFAQSMSRRLYDIGTKKSRLFPLILLLALLIGAGNCAAPSPEEAAFAHLFPVEDANRSLSLRLLETSTMPSGATLFTLALSNASQYLTTFPPGYGARGFIWRKDIARWQEVKNEVEFQDLELALGAEGSDQTSLGFVEFSSLQSELVNGSQLRVVVRGTQREKDTAPRADVLAFVDINLSP